jgi:parallel beta-helix repeat protein
MDLLPKTRAGRSLLLSIILSGTVHSGMAYGATRYVDNSATRQCRDSESFGSEAQPWCTISYAIGRLKGGDELYVKQGRYDEDVYIDGPSGSPGKPTVIRTYPGHRVTIRGEGNTGRVKITGVSYLTLDGFTITNFQQGLFVEGASRHIVVQNCTIHDVGQEALHVKENSSFVTIEGCTIYNTQVIGGCCNGEGIYVGTSSSGPLDNTNNVTVRNNRIHDTTDEGIELKPGTHHCVVEGNDLYANNTKISSPAGAIEVNHRDNPAQSWSGNPEHLVRNNRIHDNKAGIRLGTGATAYNNVIYNTGGYPGIFVDNVNNDNFTRYVYHNTVHVIRGGIRVSGGAADVRNNIGTTGVSNVTFNPAFFVDVGGHDYRLVHGAVPVNTGVDLRSAVPADHSGALRDARPDLGAYESGAPANPLPASDWRYKP